MKQEYEYEIWQGHACQAGGITATPESAIEDADHYAMMYGQDGPVEVRFYVKQEVKQEVTRAELEARQATNKEKGMEELLNALHGGKGSLDAWLECCNEDEVRAAILALVSPTETLRDKFAGQALLVLVPAWLNSDGYATVPNVAKDAYRMADAMLEARQST